MTKAEIVNEIAKTTGIEKASVLAVVEGLMTSIKDSPQHLQEHHNHHPGPHHPGIQTGS